MKINSLWSLSLVVTLISCQKTLPPPAEPPAQKSAASATPQAPTPPPTPAPVPLPVLEPRSRFSAVSIKSISLSWSGPQGDIQQQVRTVSFDRGHIGRANEPFYFENSLPGRLEIESPSFVDLNQGIDVSFDHKIIDPETSKVIAERSQVDFRNDGVIKIERLLSAESSASRGIEFFVVRFYHHASHEDYSIELAIQTRLPRVELGESNINLSEPLPGGRGRQTIKTQDRSYLLLKTHSVKNMEAKSIRVFYRSLLEGKLVKNSMLYGISGNRSTGTYDCKETQIITPNQEILTEKIWVANMNAGVLSELGSAESNRRAAVTVRPGQTLVLGFFVSNENVVLSELYNSPKSTVRPYSAMMAQSCHAACTGPLNAELTACAPSPAEPYCAEYLTQCRDRCKNQGDPSCSACAITESLAARTDNRYRSRCSGSWFAKVVNIEGKTGPLDVGIQLEFLPAMKSISIGYELTTSSDTHVDYDFSELLKPSTWDF